jgi:gluconokinase
MHIIMMGVAGSGKTTIGKLLAKELGCNFFDADDFHSPSNRGKMSEGIPLTDEDRASWLFALRDVLVQNDEAGKSVVLACSALKETYRKTLEIHPEVRFVYLKGTYEQIEERLKTRSGHFMQAIMLASQFEILEEPKDTLMVDITLSPEEIVQFICKGLNL